MLGPSTGIQRCFEIDKGSAFASDPVLQNG